MGKAGAAKKLALPAGFDLAVAFTAVHWFTLVGLKGYLGLFAAFAAYCGEHLAWTGTGTSIAIAIASAALAACGAALRLIGVALGGKEFLFSGSEAEIRPAIRTLDWLVLISHR